MRVGLLGRDAATMQRAIAMVIDAGHEPVGTLDDEEALAMVRRRGVGALVIGGGVEADARARLLEACREADVRSLQVFGPGNLPGLLATLS